MNETIWVVVEYVMWEYCCIVGIFQTEQEAIDLQSKALNERQAVGIQNSQDYFLSRHEVP